ncbi:protein KAKU4 isoform X2 [Euphorbia lathyris]|uniref:protein KAKU4 isoform X2 n=1 Tax=Euphorbia lathyris TaxID=212925 RepID=UPI0033131D00
MVSQKAADLRSGGKILRARRTAAPRTPYDRPSHLLPNSSPQNPNWLSKLIISPTRMIATGAGKLFSTFLSESSSSSSSSDDDFTSEDDSGDAYVDDDTGVSTQDANKLEKFDSSGKDPQAIEWKSETKRAIERLLMQETFSREECDRLTYIIKSRVVDPHVSGGIDGRLSNICTRAFGSAVTEAKKWVEQKKLGSNSKPQLEYGTCSLNTAVSLHGVEGEIGSPVDLAKSYMRERPPWASPSHIQLTSPPLMGTQLFKEDTPYLHSSNSVSASKLITDFPSAGTWNITEEIRKVRSKATEDMLRRRPLLITEFSTLASDNKRSPISLVADKAESVPQIPQDRLLNQASPPDPAASISQQSQDLIAIRITEGVEALPGSSEGGLSYRERLQPSEDMKAESQNGNTAGADGPKDAGGAVGEDTQDRSQEINFSTLVEVTVVDGAVAANGFSSLGSSLHAEQEGEEKSKLSSEHNKHVSEHDNKNTTVPVDETHELLNESDMEFPIVNDDNNNNNSVEATVSQTSSSMQHEEVSQDEEILPLNLKRKAGKNNDNNNDDAVAMEKQQRGGGGRRRYARKGKGQIK